MSSSNQLQLAGKFQRIDGALAERLEVLAAEIADRVVIGMATDVRTLAATSRWVARSSLREENRPLVEL